MDIVFYILKQKFSLPGKILKSKETAPKIVFFAFLGIFCAVALAEFFGFFRAFRLLQGQEFFGPPLTLFVLEEFFLFVSVLFVLSFLIAGFFIFYKSSDFRFLLSLPIPPRDLFILKYLESLLVSSWPIVFLGIPMTLAYGFGTGAGIIFYFLALFVSLFYVLFLSLISAFLCFVFGFFYKRVSVPVTFFLTAVFIFAIGYFLALVPN